jgi:hypothetical protein
VISTKAYYKFRPVTISRKESPLRQHTGTPLVIMQHNQPTTFGSRVLGVPGDYDLHFSGNVQGDTITGTAMLANQPQHSSPAGLRLNFSVPMAEFDIYALLLRAETSKRQRTWNRQLDLRSRRRAAGDFE